MFLKFLLIWVSPSLTFIFHELKGLGQEFPLWRSGLMIWHGLCGGTGSIPSPAHWVKNLLNFALLQRWPSWQLQLRFDSWLRHFHNQLKKEKE